jgi:hypothetical protein
MSSQRRSDRVSVRFLTLSTLRARTSPCHHTSHATERTSVVSSHLQASASGQQDRGHATLAYIDQMHRSCRGQCPVTSSDLFSPFFLHRVDPYQLQLLLPYKCAVTSSDLFSPLFLHRDDPHQLQLLLSYKCANIIECTTLCACVLAFHKYFCKVFALFLPRHSILTHMQGYIAQVTLDDRYANKFTPLDSTIIYPNPVINFSTHL